MKIKKKYFVWAFFVFFFHISAEICAQNAYKGGSGDGFAFSELRLTVAAQTDERKSEFLRFSNPTEKGKDIYILFPEKQEYRLEIFDIYGVKTVDLTLFGKENRISTVDFHVGVYFFRFSKGAKIETRKAIIF
jgi:hypothetical protein